MSLSSPSRSRLHEAVLALCVLGCVANSLRQREPRRLEPVLPVAESTAAAGQGAPKPVLDDSIATEPARPEAR